MGSHGKKVDPAHCTKQIISITTSNSLIVDNFKHQITRDGRGGEKLRNSESKSYCFQGLCNELQVLRVLVCPKQNCLTGKIMQLYPANAVMAPIPMHCTNPAVVAPLHNHGRTVKTCFQLSQSRPASVQTHLCEMLKLNLPDWATETKSPRHASSELFKPEFEGEMGGKKIKERKKKLPMKRLQFSLCESCKKHHHYYSFPADALG